MTIAPQNRRRSTIALDAEGLRQNLRMILAHLCDLHLLGSEAYGHFSAANSLPTMQLLLDGIVQTVREATDTLAERLRALDTVSYGSSTTTVPALPPGERSTAAMLDRIVHRIVTVVDIIDGVHDRVDASDSSTGELLRAITHAFDQHAGTLKSQRQNRK